MSKEIAGVDHKVDPRSWTLQEWRQIGWVNLSASTIISHTPAFIFAAWICSDGGGEADSILYDGHHAAELKLIHLDTLDENMFSLPFNPPLYFAKGIYLAIGTNVAQVGIQYLLDPDR